MAWQALPPAGRWVASGFWSAAHREPQAMSFGVHLFSVSYRVILGVCACGGWGGGTPEPEAAREADRWLGGLSLHSHPHQSQTHAICPAAHCPRFPPPPPAHSCVPSVNTIPCGPQGPTSPPHTQASQLPPPLHTDPVHTDHFRFRFPASPA